MTIHRQGTRLRLLLALLLAALVAGAIPVRPPASSRSGEKASGTSAWRAAPVRLMAARPDAELRGFAPLAAVAPDPPLPPPLARRDARRPAPAEPAAAPAPRSPLPRAPPRA